MAIAKTTRTNSTAIIDNGLVCIDVFEKKDDNDEKKRNLVCIVVFEVDISPLLHSASMKSS